MNDRIRTAAGWIIIILILCQFVPLDRYRSSAIEMPKASTAGEAALRDRCGQCHSNEVEWPRIAYIAPISWYVVGQADRARNAMNISLLHDGTPQDTRNLKNAVIRRFGGEPFPGRCRIPGFDPAEISAGERQLLLEWASRK